MKMNTIDYVSILLALLIFLVIFMYNYKKGHQQEISSPINLLTMNSEIIENSRWIHIYAALKIKNEHCHDENTLRLFYYASLVFKHAANTNQSDCFIFYNTQGVKKEQTFKFCKLFIECQEKNLFTINSLRKKCEIFNFGVKSNYEGQIIISLDLRRNDLTKFNSYIFLRIFNTFKHLFDENVQKLLCEKYILHGHYNTAYSVIDVLGGFFLYEMYIRQFDFKCIHQK